MVAQGNVGLAFGLVIGAGLATAIGAAFVLFGNVCKPRILAASLGFAAGVMLYVSFAEIYSRKALQGFVEAGQSEDAAVRNSTFCFFGGIVVVYILDAIVQCITAFAIWLRKRELKKMPGVQSLKRLLSRKSLAQSPSDQGSQADVETNSPQQQNEPVTLTQNPLTKSGSQRKSVEVDPEQGKEGAKETVQECSTLGVVKQHVEGLMHQVQHAMCDPLPEAGEAAAQTASMQETEEEEGGPSQRAPLPVPRDPDVVKILQEDHHHFALMKMGVLTAIAIAIHNLPEGLATFVAALAEPSLGITLAIAIAIHNIPEGLCVALPIYYATGSKWKGFFWGVMSGLSEPLGGLLGYFILYNTQNPLVYAIVFGLVAGMMVCISLRELLPAALRYDNNHGLVVLWLFLGMVVMAASLLLFTL